MSSDQLAVMAAGGDGHAFAELFQRYYPRVLNYLENRNSVQRHDAEEIAQETFAKAWQSIQRYDSNFRFTTWLYTIAQRTAVDRWRKRKPNQEITTWSNRQWDEIGQAKEEYVVVGCDNLWQLARDQLSESHYRALWLRYAEEMSLSEIARVMHRSNIGTRVLLYRARAALQLVLESCEVD